MPAPDTLLQLPTDTRPEREADRTLALIDRMIDWRLVNPAGRWRQAAAAFGCPSSTLYSLAQTDLFRTRYAERRGRIEQQLDIEIRQQTHGLMHQALDYVQKELDAGAATADFALRAFNDAAKMLGIAPDGAAVRGNSVHVDRAVIVQGTLQDARDLIRTRHMAELPPAA